MQEFFSEEDIRDTYREVYDLFVTRHIIRQHSSNQRDIRDVALEGLKLKESRQVLELGCGYGFFVEKLLNRLHAKALITGIDLVENNREPFLHSVRSSGYRGKFLQARAADAVREMPSESFDLIIASYSLYFFPDIISDIATLLAPKGIFITVTHSSHTLSEATGLLYTCLLNAGIKIPDDFLLNRLFRAFSLENGEELLLKHFDHVSPIVFENRLLFNHETVDDCIYYIAKKKHLFYKEVVNRYPEKLLDIEACLAGEIYRRVKVNGSICLNKNDAVFRCTGGKK